MDKNGVQQAPEIWCSDTVTMANVGFPIIAKGGHCPAIVGLRVPASAAWVASRRQGLVTGHTPAISGRLLDEFGRSGQVVVGKGVECQAPSDLVRPYEPCFGQPADGLTPIKELLDALPRALTGEIALMPGRACIDRAVSLLASEVRGDVAFAQGGHEALGVVARIGAQGQAWLGRDVSDHLQRGVALRRPAGFGQAGVDDQPATVYHQGLADVAQVRRSALGVAVQPCIGIGSRGVGVVLAWLAAEVDAWISVTFAAASVAAVASAGVVLAGNEALHQGPGRDERAIDGEVVVGQKRADLGQFSELLEQRMPDHTTDQRVAVLRERGRMPDLVIHVEADEPAKQQVVLDLLHEQPLGADGVQPLKQRRPEELFRPDRRPVAVGVEPEELAGEFVQDLVEQGANASPRLVVRDTGLQAHVAEQGPLLDFVTTHPERSGEATHDASDDIKPSGRRAFSVAC